jgi:hypothetical protein
MDERLGLRGFACAPFRLERLTGGSMITGLPTVGRSLVGSILEIARLRILADFCDKFSGITNA